MGDELRYQSWIFDMFILDRINREPHSFKFLDLNPIQTGGGFLNPPSGKIMITPTSKEL